MNADAIWQAFAETGDPLYYLLYQMVSQSFPGEETQTARDHRAAG